VHWKWGSDTITNFRNIIGSRLADTLIGDSQANNINGGEMLTLLMVVLEMIL
jgi:hypothetical protein